MKKVLLILWILAVATCGFAQDFVTAGFYEGDRDFNPAFQKKLDKYSKKHFELLQNGDIAEADQIYSSKIAPYKKENSGSKQTCRRQNYDPNS